MSSSAPRCSGFISTERSAVTVPPAPQGSPKKAAGNSASARCKPAFSAFSKISRARAEDSCGGLRAQGPDDDIELGRKGGDVTRVILQVRVELERCGAAVVQHARELAAANQRQQPLRRPERDRRGAGPRAFEADLAEVQLLRTEIGVRRVVPVVDADRGIAKQHAAAAVGLQAVLVRIDDDRIDLVEAVEGRACLGRRGCRQARSSRRRRNRRAGGSRSGRAASGFPAADPPSRPPSCRASRRRCRRRRP